MVAMAQVRHHLHSFRKRALYSFFLVSAVLVIGTVGMHLLEGYSYLDAFYFISMIATAQGPSVAPVTAAGKIFTAVIAFVSVGFVVAALGFLFGPLLGLLFRLGHERFEEEIKELKGK